MLSVSSEVGEIKVSTKYVYITDSSIAQATPQSSSYNIYIFYNGNKKYSTNEKNEIGIHAKKRRRRRVEPLTPSFH